MRVVSLLPSATEIVVALGHGHELVARSADCDHPPSVRSLPEVMRPRGGAPDGPSRAIDDRVRAARALGESLYALDVALLKGLRPDLILTQNLCGVCSVTEGEVDEACRAAGVRPEIVSLTPRRLEEVWTSVETVARALHDVPAGTELADRLRSRSRATDAASETPRVAVVEWLDPPILAGLWAADQVRDGGGLSVGPAPGEPGRRTTWDDLARALPELVVLSPCSFPVDRTARELEEPGLAEGVRSVRPSRGTFLADEAFFSRPGPRLADGVELVRGLLAGARTRFPMDVVPWTGNAPRISA